MHGVRISNTIAATDVGIAILSHWYTISLTSYTIHVYKTHMKLINTCVKLLTDKFVNTSSKKIHVRHTLKHVPGSGISS